MSDVIVTFQTDVTVTTHFVDPSGRPVRGQAGREVYHLSRTKVGRHWNEVMTRTELPTFEIVNAKGATVPLVRTQRVARLEDDGDGSALRIYDENGRLIRQPATDVMSNLRSSGARISTVDIAEKYPWQTRTSRRTDSDDNLEGVVLFASAKSAREDKIRRSLGSPRSFVGRRNQYLRAQGKILEEVLIEPEIAAVVEMNLMDDGQLQSHTTMEWVPDNGGFHYRRSLRSELQSQYPAPGSRVVVETVYSNVRAARAGGR